MIFSGSIQPPLPPSAVQAFLTALAEAGVRERIRALGMKFSDGDTP